MTSGTDPDIYVKCTNRLFLQSLSLLGLFEKKKKISIDLHFLFKVNEMAPKHQAEAVMIS